MISLTDIFTFCLYILDWPLSYTVSSPGITHSPFGKNLQWTMKFWHINYTFTLQSWQGEKVRYVEIENCFLDCTFGILLQWGALLIDFTSYTLYRSLCQFNFEVYRTILHTRTLQNQQHKEFDNSSQTKSIEGEWILLQ